jgi:hypothetical protein
MLPLTETSEKYLVKLATEKLLFNYLKKTLLLYFLNSYLKSK